DAPGRDARWPPLHRVELRLILEGAYRAGQGRLACWPDEASGWGQRGVHSPATRRPPERRGAVLRLRGIVAHATADIGTSNYTVTLVAGHHALTADEGAAAGGQDAGATPHELLCAALGACTAITLRMYAQRKEWPLH